MMRRIQVLWILSSPGTRNSREIQVHAQLSIPQRLESFVSSYAYISYPICSGHASEGSEDLVDCYLIVDLSDTFSDTFSTRLSGVLRSSTTSTILTPMSTNELSGLLTLENDTPTARVL